MTRLPDLFPLTELEERIAAGLVSRKQHPAEPLAILNYTHRCQYERAWDEITRQTRGLIYRLDTLALVARPWPKFFNHGEPGAPDLDLAAPVEVTDKIDGSLGILYPASDGGWAVATRGSFTSEQARHATDVLRSRYPEWEPPTGCATLVEIVYPANRIVIDYEGLDDLVYLASLRIDDGTVEPWYWPGPIAAEFDYDTLAEALAAPPRPNREGLVVYLPHLNERVKIKQADYVELHRLVTGLNERVVWEHLGCGGTVAELCEPLPDEFHSWVADVAERLAAARDHELELARSVHESIVTLLGDDFDRKTYAEHAKRHAPLTPYLFNLLDGRDPSPAIWRTLKPSGANTLVAVSEDVA